MTTTIDPRIMGLRELQLPAPAFATTAEDEHEALIVDWVDGENWLPGPDGIPCGLIVVGGAERDLAWNLLMKELYLAGNYVTRTNATELALHACHTDTMTYRVVGSMLEKCGYPVGEEEAANNPYNTLTLGSAHIFIENLHVTPTKDRLIQNYVREAVLLLAYYTSVYVRLPEKNSMDDLYGRSFYNALTDGKVAKLSVWE